MKKHIHLYANFIIERRWLVIFVSLIILFMLTLSLSSLKNVWTYEMWFQDGDQRMVTYQNFKERFGEGMYMLVGIEADPEKTVFEKNTLKNIDLLTRYFEESDFVDGTISLTNYHLLGQKNGKVRFQRLFSKGVDFASYTPQELKERSELMQLEERAHKYLLTKDAKRTVIQAKMSYRGGEMDHYFTLVRELRQFIAENQVENQNFKLYLSGGPYIYERFDYFAQKDFGTAIPLMFLLAIVFLVGLFRSFAGFFLPVFVVIGTILSTFGTLALSGGGIDIVNVNLLLLILIVGMADAIHIMVDFYRYRREGYIPKDASRKTIESLFIPCLFTTLTTALGFLSLYSSEMPPIQNFGLWGAFGVVLAFVYSLMTLPALLSFVSKVPKTRVQGQSFGLLSKFFDKLVAFLEVRGKQVLMGFAVVFLVLVAFSSQITVDYHYIKTFKESTRVRQDVIFFDESFGGVRTFEVIIDSGKDNGVFDADFIEKASRFEKYIATTPDIGKTTSPLFTLNVISNLQALDESGSTRELALAEDFRRLLQEKASGDIYSFVSLDERFIRIQITMPILPTSRTTEILDDIRAVSAHDYREFEVDVTGGHALMNQLNQYIREGMLTSLSLALACIFICLLVLLKSFKFSLIALVPAVIPIVVAGGVMGAFTIYLDLTNMIVAAVTIGIAIDDAIHVTIRYMRARQSAINQVEAIKIALNESGKAVIYTSMILIAGFSILMTSSFIPNIYYGLLSVIVITFALISVVVVLPALLLHYDGGFISRSVRKGNNPKLETVPEGVFQKGMDSV